MKTLIATAVLGSLLFLTGGCSSGYDGNGVQELSRYPIMRATGYAIISRQPGPTGDDRILQAMRASKLDAYRELSEQVFGQQLIANTDLRDNIQTDNELRARTAGIIKGARVIRSYPLNNTYVTELELDSRLIYDLYKMRGAL